MTRIPGTVPKSSPPVKKIVVPSEELARARTSLNIARSRGIEPDWVEHWPDASKGTLYAEGRLGVGETTHPELYYDNGTGWGVFYLYGSVTWDPNSIAVGGSETKDVTVTNAALGMFTMAAFSLDLQGLTLTSYVSSASTVTAVLANNTTGAVDLNEGTLRVRVFKI